jgi:hypothetical protein
LTKTWQLQNTPEAMQCVALSCLIDPQNFIFAFSHNLQISAYLLFPVLVVKIKKKIFFTGRDASHPEVLFISQS